jgi:hypothetical protein
MPLKSLARGGSFLFVKTFSIHSGILSLFFDGSLNP